MLIDDVTIRVKAGNGGRGAVAFQRNMMSLGPTGATGGHGGSVYLEGVSDLAALNHFRNRKEFNAMNGGEGRGQFRDGANGENLVLMVPVGTVAHNLDSSADQEVIRIGERLLVAAGGKGGKGNFHFRSSRNTSPKQFQLGLPGEHFTLRLELKLIADVGLIGLPNVGKSSLLNELTSAQAKVANYAFTTLEPNLGAYHGGLIIADLPGLIEGASKGKGLGDKFLRHIERTRVLFHLVSAEAEDVVRDYKTIRQELGEYRTELLDKPEYVFLSKSDAVPAAELKSKLAALRRRNSHAAAISIIDPASLEQVRKILNQLAQAKQVKREVVSD